MEWFRDDGCLTDEGLRALTAGQLDEIKGLGQPGCLRRSCTAQETMSAPRATS